MVNCVSAQTGGKCHNRARFFHMKKCSVCGVGPLCCKHHPHAAHKKWAETLTMEDRERLLNREKERAGDVRWFELRNRQMASRGAGPATQVILEEAPIIGNEVQPERVHLVAGPASPGEVSAPSTGLETEESPAGAAPGEEVGGNPPFGPHGSSASLSPGGPPGEEGSD